MGKEESYCGWLFWNSLWPRGRQGQRYVKSFLVQWPERGRRVEPIYRATNFKNTAYEWRLHSVPHGPPPSEPPPVDDVPGQPSHQLDTPPANSVPPPRPPDFPLPSRTADQLSLCGPR